MPIATVTSVIGRVEEIKGTHDRLLVGKIPALKMLWERFDSQSCYTNLCEGSFHKKEDNHSWCWPSEGNSQQLDLQARKPMPKLQSSWFGKSLDAQPCCRSARSQHTPSSPRVGQNPYQRYLYSNSLSETPNLGLSAGCVCKFIVNIVPNGLPRPVACVRFEPLPYFIFTRHLLKEFPSRNFKLHGMIYKHKVVLA